MRGRDDLLEDVLASDLVDDPERSAAAEPAHAELTAARRHAWGRSAALAAATLGAACAFFAAARAIEGPRGTAFDRAIVRSLGRARTPLGNATMAAITALGSAVGATVVSVASVAKARRRPRLALQIMVGALGGSAAELFVKRLFRRERPTLLPHLEDVASTSFPSGHATAAASLYLTLAFVASRSRRLRARRRALLAGAGAVAAAVGASRVYLGVHWPTDVLGGVALGTAWACAAEAAFDFTGADRLRARARRSERDALRGTSIAASTYPA